MMEAQRSQRGDNILLDRQVLFPEAPARDIRRKVEANPYASRKAQHLRQIKTTVGTLPETRREIFQFFPFFPVLAVPTMPKWGN